MSSIPAGSSVTSAVFEGYVEYSTGGSMTGDYAVYQIAQTWVENEATWENVQTGKKWINAGGDYISQAVAKVTWPRSNGNTWIKFNVLPLIQSFVKFPDMNHGMLIKNISGSQEIRFPSSEDSSAALRPKLTITYEEGSPTINPKKNFMVTGVALNVRPDGLHLDVKSTSPAVQLTLSLANGRQVVRNNVATGCSKTVTGLSAGVYIITLKQAGRTVRTPVSIVP